MIATYRMFVVCVILCTVHSVHSVQIRGTIRKNNVELPSEIAVLNYINGKDFSKVLVLTLDRLVNAVTLPTLTVANFKSIQSLYLTNISLEHVPTFVNTNCKEIHITGNKIKSVPANAFSGPRPLTLDLSKNEIQTIADRSINIDASRVYLQCNQINHFSQSWFESPGNIVALNLGGNRIEYIQDRAFNRMTKLVWLELGYNHIKSLGSEAFSYGIVTLGLQFNDIAQLRPDMFAHRVIPMSVLYLHHNQLNYLPEALLVKLKPRAISLVGNPWQCQCLQDLERWLRKLNSTRWDIPARRGEPVCVVPRNFVNLCIQAVDKELQQTYARGLSPLPECWVSPCQCKIKDIYLSKST